MSASPSLLLISASFHWPHSPATSLQASLVPPLADRLLAAMGPCLRAGFPLLGRCPTARNRNKRSAKHGDEDSSENKMCHDYLPNTCRRETRSPASPVAAPAPRAATRQPRRQMRPTIPAVRW